MSNESTMLYLIAEPFDGRCLSLVLNGLVHLSGYLYNNNGPDVSVKEYERLTGRAVKAVSEAKFEGLTAEYNKREYLDKPATAITQERFHHMLDVLPPQNWINTPDFERFNMQEHVTGTITEQLVRHKDKYLSLFVDATDASTWVTQKTVQEKIDQVWPTEGAA